MSTVRIEKLSVTPLSIPTEKPESDGTLSWSETSVLLVEVAAGGEVGLGYSYAGEPGAALVRGKLAKDLHGLDALDVPYAWNVMVHSVRNMGRPGIASHAISAVDVALWDLKAKLLGLPLCRLLGSERRSVPVYGSGGFTSLTLGELEEQLGGWVAQGIRRVKMKVGRRPGADLERVRVARAAIGESAKLFVDANGAYGRKQALAFAERFAAHGVSWFEEPVSSDDLEGLRLLRDRAPAGMNVAAGEYGYDSWYFLRMLQAQAVDVLQADAGRCLGITGFLRVAALADAFEVPLSSHTAPVLHLHACLAAPRVVNMEWFHDHVRIERMLFEGAPEPRNGSLAPDLSQPGLGVTLKRREVRRLAA